MKFLQTAMDTAPGPDGIPYRAWRALGKEGVVILHEVAKQMQEEGSVDKATAAYGRRGGDGNSHNFNLGNMCCLPKKASCDSSLRGRLLRRGCSTCGSASAGSTHSSLPVSSEELPL